MSEKDKKESKETVDETTKGDAPDLKTNADDSKLEGDKSKKPKESEDSIDYKAELEKAQATLVKAEEKIVKLKKQSKQPKSDDDEEEVDISAIVKEAVSSEIQNLRVSDQQDFVDETIDKMCKTDDEKELVKFLYKNRITKTGTTKASIAEDLEDAKILANKKTIVQENEELRKLAASKSSITNSGQGNAVKKPKGSEKKVTDEDRRVAERFFGGDINRYLKSKQKTN